jgi:Fur family transcriptional regulator, ferric uptake regulator
MEAKLTQNQEKILDFLRSYAQEISAQDLYAAFHHRNQMIGLATIYRSLRSLQLAGKVQVRTVNGEAVYSLATEEYHCLTCLQCGTSLRLEDCPVHELEQQLEQGKKFKIYYHTLEFFGLCSPCAERTT